MPSTITPAEILDFWFGDAPDDVTTAKTQAKLWWSKNPDLDAAVRTRFADLLGEPPSRPPTGWDGSARDALASILVCDQFPRNIYRGTPQAFAYDHLALKRSLQGLEREWDRRLRPIERVFFYLPLEHSEVLAYQERSVELFRQLADEVPEAARTTFARFLDYALRHREIIARFGRFPHRNAILGRTSTTAEEIFLAQPGSSF